MEEKKKYIEVKGARVHNLKNIDVSIPQKSLTVITGLSGSGKSSLAFDTIYAEGQRRYIDTFSAYARQYIGNIERPDVDQITGLSPVIAIEQKTTNKNPRSTVGTTTEIYDFLRLLYARIGEAYSYLSGDKMVKHNDEEILSLIYNQYEGKKCYILAPLIKNRKGHYKELFEQLRKIGFLSVKVDGEIKEIGFNMRLDRYKNHDIDVVVDKLLVKKGDEERIKKSIATATKLSSGIVMIMDFETEEFRYLSKQLMCPSTGLSYQEPAPHNFSFNSPKGACEKCKGLGEIKEIDIDKIIPDKKLSIAKGGIVPLGPEKNSLIFWQIRALCEKHKNITTQTPIKDLPKELIDEILNGTEEPVKVSNKSLGTNSNYFANYEGVIKYIEIQQENGMNASELKWANSFFTPAVCPSCNGARLNNEALHYKLDNKNIAEVSKLDLQALKEWIEELPTRLNDRQKIIAEEIIKEIAVRLSFLLNVGLGYLSLSRSTGTLSGGESQRIRLATQIGSELVNVLYILDEPSIGLHQRDNEKLIKSLKSLRDANNTVIVVEHDEDMMKNADYIIDLGPKAGRLGGEVVFMGEYDEMLKSDTSTAKYLNGINKIEIQEKRREGNGKTLSLKGATGNNLKNVDIDIPLGCFVCITGVSGSGKSSLINNTLHPILSTHFYRSLTPPLPYKSIEGIEHIDKVIEVNQSPIGRTPRSNPVTYSGVFTDIRTLFATLPEAKMRGYKPGRFSFNTAGGRCEVCSGNGYKSIEMNFLPDVMVPCDSCHGKRYNRETLEVRFKGKSIADVLDMTFNQAVEFFENMPNLVHKLKVMQDVGLGYIKLGQSSTTLSGGESQRIKLASELSKRDTGKTLYILDEPTTGLHFEDIRVLLGVLNRLVGKGNSVIVIEHNLDVIKCADWIVDLGPEAGRFGGQIVAHGTPEEIAKNPNSTIAKYLEKLV